MVSLSTLRIHQVINQPVNSNCFVLSHPASDTCIVYDPGTVNNATLLEYLVSSNLQPRLVLITHEHFDHCAGVDALADDYSFRLIASEQTAARIKNSKTNFSTYYEAVEPFEVLHPVEIVKDGELIEHENQVIRCLETPGHSPGSMCFFIDNFVFTGDTLLNGTKTPLKLPGSNKLEYHSSIKKLRSLINPGSIIYPGHGQPFRVLQNKQKQDA